MTTLLEAQLFAAAEDMLVEVLGRVGDADLTIELPPIAGVTGRTSGTLEHVLQTHAGDEATVPRILAGEAVREIVPTTLDDDRRAQLDNLAAESVAAARNVLDGTELVRAPFGDVPVRDYLLRVTVVRSLVAHYVAAYLGSTACPLPEELARPLWELTAGDAEAWRTTGLFREPTPVPQLASWRDTFLRTAGHEPHPLGH